MSCGGASGIQLCDGLRQVDERVNRYVYARLGVDGREGPVVVVCGLGGEAL